jgi:hypothetical protein
MCCRRSQARRSRQCAPEAQRQVQLSMARLGQLTPVQAYRVGKGLKLFDGFKRVRAARELSWPVVRARGTRARRGGREDAPVAWQVPSERSRSQWVPVRPTARAKRRSRAPSSARSSTRERSSRRARYEAALAQAEGARRASVQSSLDVAPPTVPEPVRAVGPSGTPVGVQVVGPAGGAGLIAAASWIDNTLSCAGGAAA